MKLVDLRGMHLMPISILGNHDRISERKAIFLDRPDFLKDLMNSRLELGINLLGWHEVHRQFHESFSNLQLSLQRGEVHNHVDFYKICPFLHYREVANDLQKKYSRSKEFQEIIYYALLTNTVYTFMFRRNLEYHLFPLKTDKNFIEDRSDSDAVIVVNAHTTTDDFLRVKNIIRKDLGVNPTRNTETYADYRKWYWKLLNGCTYDSICRQEGGHVSIQGVRLAVNRYIDRMYSV